MNSKDFLKEGFVEDATNVHLDHEVQMAREECYHAAEHALAIHKLLRNVSEQQGLEGWVSSKITLANDYLNTVREHLEYELLNGGPESLDQLAIGMPIAETSDYARRREREEKIISGEKPARRRAPAQTSDYTRRRTKEKQQGVSEGSDDTAAKRQAKRDQQRTAPAQQERNKAQRKGLMRDKDGTYYAKKGVAEGVVKSDYDLSVELLPSKSIPKIKDELARVGIDLDDVRRHPWEQEAYVFSIYADGNQLQAAKDIIWNYNNGNHIGVSKGRPQDDDDDIMEQSVTKGSGTDSIEAHGVRGMKSTPWRKTFKNQAAFDRWLEKNESDVEVHGTRKVKQDVAEGSNRACALAEWKKLERAKRMKEQTTAGITDTEIQQRIQPKNQNLPTDPAGMKAAGLVPAQDYDASIAAADTQNRALGSAQRSGFPTYQHQGQTYGVMNPQAGKGGVSGTPKPLTPQQIQKTAGTNIVSGSGDPVTAGHKMLTPGQRMGGMNEMSKSGKKAKNNKYKEVTKESNVLLKLLGLGRKSKSLPKKEPNITFTPSANADTAGTYSPALDDMAAQIIRSNRKQTIDRENLSPALDDMAAQILQNQPVVIKPTVRGPHIDRSNMNETSAGSVAGVVNPKSTKPKSKIGSLFGGTYRQPKKAMSK